MANTLTTQSISDARTILQGDHRYFLHGWPSSASSEGRQGESAKMSLGFGSRVGHVAATAGVCPETADFPFLGLSTRTSCCTQVPVWN